MKAKKYDINIPEVSRKALEKDETKGIGGNQSIAKGI